MPPLVLKLLERDIIDWNSLISPAGIPILARILYVIAR